MSAISGISESSQDLKLNYLNLLVTQLQNQNPLEPMDNADMTAQLAQISQLEQLEAMNTNFSKVLASTEASYATGLLGREIAFPDPESDGEGVATGRVTAIAIDADGTYLRVGERPVSLADVLGIRE